MVKKSSGPRGCYKSDGGEVCFLLHAFLVFGICRIRVLEYLLVILHVFMQSHLKQVEDDYKDRLEKEFSARKQFEKVFYSSSDRC
jgi:hypothetical protein